MVRTDSMGNIHKAAEFPDGEIPPSANKMTKDLNISEI
jgi:hypothetical protein